tara:strand:- start:5306 stop:5824 length:519 start_codon:yes stop_codon:yes gene_type:complete
MSIAVQSFKKNFVGLFPIILLYFLSISEIDTHFSNMFEILSFNLQLIIIYYWMLKDQSILGNGHVFFAGIINDVVSGLPLGVSALTYLTVSFVAMYVKNVTVNITLFTDWFTFLIAVFFSNLIFLILIYNFTELSVTYTEIFYNSFFTLLFYPLFWLIFNIYRSIAGMKNYD